MRQQRRDIYITAGNMLLDFLTVGRIYAACLKN